MKYRYPFTHHIVFALVMQDKNRCKALLQLSFPDRVIEDVRLHSSFLDTEHTAIVGIDSRKVRLDVLFADEHAWYDIEMQVEDERNIPKRSRSANSILDVDSLRPGQDFSELKPIYVIFLCCFDPFGAGLSRYQLSMMDEENHLPLGRRNLYNCFEQHCYERADSDCAAGVVSLHERRDCTGGQRVSA